MVGSKLNASYASGRILDKEILNGELPCAGFFLTAPTLVFEYLYKLISH